MNIPSHYIQVGDIKLHVKVVGEPDAPTIIFLHGYPEFWYGWKAQIDYFSRKGYHVVVPDQRGYNLSDKPEKVNQYRLRYLAADILGLIKHFGKEKVFLVGHDWGGAVAWDLALLHPAYFHKVVILNLPHPLAFKKTLLSSLRQLLNSWYFFFFQIPKLPEYYLGRNNCAHLVENLPKTALPGTFTPEIMEHYRKAWCQPNALKSMINWYRASIRNMSDGKAYEGKKVGIPLKLIWGKKDQFLLSEMAEKSLSYCENGSLHYIEDATHWVAHERAEEVNKVIDAFFG